MKRFIALLMVALMLFAFGCTKDENVDEFAELISYVEDMGGFQFKVAAAPDDTTQTAEAQAATFLAGYELIIDVRTAADYGVGHLAGAENWTTAEFKTKLAEANPTGKVLVYCYTGQTAGFIQTIGKMMGYDVYSLKYGMSGWNTTYDKITANLKSGVTTWSEDDAVPTPETYDAPVLETGETDGAAILDARLDVVLPLGLQGFSADASLPDKYVINYWSATDWATYGHVANAYQLTPGTVLSDQNLYTIPTDVPVYIYCYTGQTSAALSTYLNVLGYNAISIKYGTQGMIADKTPPSMYHGRYVDLPVVQ